MTLWEFLILAAIAGVCGSVGQKLAGVSSKGCLVTVFLGFIGAYFGSRLATWLDMDLGLTVTLNGQPFSIIWSVVGSALFVAGLTWLTKKSS